jgi:hypothetical protein
VDQIVLQRDFSLSIDQDADTLVTYATTNSLAAPIEVKATEEYLACLEPVPSLSRFIALLTAC